MSPYHVLQQISLIQPFLSASSTFYGFPSHTSHFRQRQHSFWLIFLQSLKLEGNKISHNEVITFISILKSKINANTPSQNMVSIKH